MKKKVLISVFIVISLVVGIFYASNISNDIQVENILGECLSYSGAEIVCSTVSGWSKIGREFLEPKEVAAIMDEIILELNIGKDDIKRVVENSENISKETIYATRNNKTYTAAIESINGEDMAETYLIMDVNIDKEYDDLINEKQAVEFILEEKGELIKCSTCVTGTLNGPLSESEIQALIKEALSKVDAREVESLVSDDISSISAFSRNISSYVVSNNRKVNIQFAMRYSSYDDKTYVWIGSPLIPIEY